MSNQFELMAEQRFRPFFFTQFLGAFNDNVFKTSLITLVAFHASAMGGLDRALMTTLLPGLFILPFFLFSATAGLIADKYEKSKLIRALKVLEVWIMVFASVGFFMHNIWLLGAALFLMGAHSSFFGPVKYSYLPQHLSEQELIGGNGMVEMGTFVAILLGQVLGAWLAAHTEHATVISITLVTIALFGYFASMGIPSSQPSAPELKINWNPISETYRNLRFAWKSQAIWLALIAISWFWFYGATILAQFPNLAKQVLHGDESVFILLLAFFSLGIGVGSLLCEKLSKGKVELGLMLLGAIGLTLFGVDMSLSAVSIHQAYDSQVLFDSMAFIAVQYDAHGQWVLTHWRLLADIALLGLFGGIYIVPLNTFIQTHAERAYKSRLIAANNILNALFMVVSAGYTILLFRLGLSIPQVFLVTACLNALIVGCLCVRQPQYVHAFLAWVKVRWR